MKIGISGILLLEASFRHTVDPLANPTLPTSPPTEAQIEVELLRGTEGNGVAVKLRVAVESPTAPYALAISHAVILSVDYEGATPPADMEQRLIITGASIAFPYAREIASNLTSRGKFGVVWLNPINFAALLPTMRRKPPLPAKTTAKKTTKKPR